MTVGETLTEARTQAGLSVEEVSERTSIRDTVIRGIEHDDYAACGGDLYVRGYVRAIAGAVGLDAQPLIQEYDEGHADDPGLSGEPDLADDLSQPDAPGPAAAAGPAVDQDLAEPALTPSGRHALSYPRSDPDPAGDPDQTRFDLPPVPADPAATRFDLPPVPAAGPAPAGPVTGDLMAAGYNLGQPAPPAWGAPPAPPAWGAPPAPPAGAPFAPPAWTTSPASPAWGASPPPPAWAAPPTSASPAGPAGDPRRKRRVLVAAAAVVVLLAAGGFLGVSLASGGGGPRSTAASSARPGGQPSGTGRASAGPEAHAAASAAASGSASGQAGAGSSAGAVPLPVAAAAAFGPHGTADGDNPDRAGRALSGQASAAWSTQWYATAKFGGLKSGTGLLLDLGATSSVSSVKLVLGHSPGATVQLRVGSKASLAGLRTAKTASGTGGTVRLTFKDPVQARYLLIWFTQLAPDGAGHYAESVSHVLVKGRS